MTEFQILSQFNAFLISNAIYLAVFTFLLWMAFRGVIRLYENGGNLLNKILSSLFSNVEAFKISIECLDEPSTIFILPQPCTQSAGATVDSMPAVIPML